MTKQVVEHEVKLEKSVKIILAALAFGVLAHALVPVLSVDEAKAGLEPGSTWATPMYVECVKGCM
jgi:hypothetical protein